MALLSSQLSNKRMVPFCRQLSTAYSAGLPVIQTLELTARECKDTRVKGILEQMAYSVRNGATLGDAAMTQQKYLPELFVQLLAAGEYGGRLDVMLRDLGGYYEDRLAMRRQAISAMLYPMFLLAALWFFGSFGMMALKEGLANFVQHDGRQDFDIGAFLVRYGYFQLRCMSVAAVVMAVFVLLARMGAFRRFISGLTTHIWPLAPVTRRMTLARFFRCFSLLLGSGVPIVQAVRQSAKAGANAYMEKQFEKAIGPIQEGATLTQAFHDVPLTSLAREMLHIGEVSGNLETHLQKLSEYHFTEARHAIDIALKVFQYVLFVSVAVAIGYFVISFYSSYIGGVTDALGV